MRRYLPWVRTGAATAITAVDPLGGAPLPERADVTVTAHINGGQADAAVAVRLLGPGDVTGVHPGQIVGMDPAPGTTNAEPNYFPAVELAGPELPWLFTPAAPTADGRLRPWLCLVVVRADAAQLVTDPNRPLPVLTVDAGEELPDLAQSWAWAHAQIHGDGAVGDAVAGRTLATSRLVAARRLRPGTSYVAALVPAFAPGRSLGLGEPVDDAAPAGPLLPAWTPDLGQIELPVYHSWQFMTGPDGDFEALVTRLRRPEDGVEVAATRDMAVTGLPGGLPDLGVVPMPGVLGGAAEDWATVVVFTAALRDLLNLPEPVPAGAAVPAGLVLPPPTYGRWHAGRRVQSRSGHWLEDLNVDPRYRVAAALGSTVVRRRQEDLMASAWRQVGQILAVNRLLRQSQLARGSGTALHTRSLVGLPPADLLLLTAPLHARVLAGATTVAATVSGSRVPAALLSPALRRAARSRGPIGRRRGLDAARLVRRVNDGDLVPVPPRRLPSGAVTVDTVAATDSRPPLCAITSSVVAGSPLPGQLWDLWRKAAAAHQARLPGCEPPAPQRRPVLDLAGLAQTLREALRPERTVTARVRSRVGRPDGWDRPDPLEPVLAAPSFPTPMYLTLAEVAPELLLPGVTGLPPDSVAAVATNPRFLEAFMVGLNHEMGRELVWRGFPTDQRGTCFRQFWDRSGAVPAATTDAEREARLDIPLITDWTGSLGSHATGGRQFVLVVRGELLRRHPRTAIYAARAEWVQTADGGWVRRPESVVDDPAAPTPGQAGFAERYPDFAGTVPPDVSFLGFNLDPVAACGDPEPDAHQPGWFLVFQQPKTGMRYGLDETAPTDPTGTWRDLAWPHVATDGAGYVKLGPLPAPPEGPDITDPGGLSWSDTATSAQVAAMVEQPPFRVAIHASDLMPEPVP